MALALLVLLVISDSLQCYHRHVLYYHHYFVVIVIINITNFLLYGRDRPVVQGIP